MCVYSKTTTEFHPLCFAVLQMQVKPHWVQAKSMAHSPTPCVKQGIGVIPP